MESIRHLYKIGYGPSSSHTMGPQRTTEIFLEKHPETKKLEVILYGSFAHTGRGHFTDVIIEKTAGDIPVKFIWRYEDVEHPNTMDLRAFDEKDELIIETRVYSIGGGNIQFADEAAQVIADVYPHNKFTAIASYCETHEMTLLDYINKFDPNLEEHLYEVWDVMQNAIKVGITTEGVLPGSLAVQRKAKELYNLESKDIHLLAYAYAVNEENAAATTKVVTAPTCGACGTLPAVLKHYQETQDVSDAKIIDALKIAGLIGTLIKTNASISGAVAGCQAEVGSATAMAAAALAFLAGKSTEIIEAAAEIAMEHQLGLTCDPVAGYVQIPCIQRNAIAAQKAYTAYKLAKAIGTTETVSFDTIVDVMYETGQALPFAYRETSTGGIATHYKNKRLV